MFVASAKNCASLLLTGIVLLQLTDAQISTGPAMHPKHPGKCYFRGLVLDYNETRYNPFPNTCCRLFCKLEQSNPVYAAFYYDCCDLIIVNPGCREISSLALAFPDCCAVPVCPGDE